MNTNSKSSPHSERKHRVKKSKRKKPEKDVAQLYPYIPISNSDQYFGKRKRSTTITQNSYEHSNSSQLSSYTANRLKKSESSAMQCDSFGSKTGGKLTKFVVQNENEMDLDGEQDEDSTSLSEESNLSDPKFEADDEQSDYYEVSSSLQKKNRARYGRTSLDSKPSFANPFSMLSSTSPSTSSSIWKRRRRNNLPNNHFNWTVWWYIRATIERSTQACSKLVRWRSGKRNDNYESKFVF